MLKPKPTLCINPCWPLATKILTYQHCLYFCLILFAFAHILNISGQVNISISTRDNYCIEVVLRCLAVAGDGIGPQEDGGILSTVMAAGFKGKRHYSGTNLVSLHVGCSCITRTSLLGVALVHHDLCTLAFA